MQTEKKTRAMRKPSAFIAFVSLLALVLLAEAAVAGFMIMRSRRAYAAHTPAQLQLDTGFRGDTLLPAQQTGVGPELLDTLTRLRESKVNLVRVPVTPAQEGDAIAKDWMGKTAATLELLFQSGFRAVLAPEAPADILAFTGLFTLLDAEFGKRTDGELWYEVRGDDLAQLAGRLEALREITAQTPRTLLAVLPDSVRPQDLPSLMEAAGGQRLALAAQGTDEAQLDALAQAAQDMGVSFLYLAPDTGAVPDFIAQKPNYCLKG